MRIASKLTAVYLTAWAVVVTSASGAFATPIAIDSVTASSTFFTYDVGHLIDGSGLSGGLHDTDFNAMWMNDGGSTASLVFDLGQTYSLNGTDIWNYNHRF